MPLAPKESLDAAPVGEERKARDSLQPFFFDRLIQFTSTNLRVERHSCCGRRAQ